MHRENIILGTVLAADANTASNHSPCPRHHADGGTFFILFKIVSLIHFGIDFLESICYTGEVVFERGRHFWFTAGSFSR